MQLVFSVLHLLIQFDRKCREDQQIRKEGLLKDFDFARNQYFDAILMAKLDAR